MINSQNHPGAMSQQQQQQQPPQQPPPSQHPQAPVYVHPSTGSYAMYQVPMMSQPGNVFVSNVTANVSVHGLMQPVQHYMPYMPAPDVAQNPVVAGHDGQVCRVFLFNSFRC